MKNHLVSILFIILLGILLVNVFAQNNVPQIINYQGFITDKDGKSSSGDFIIKFSLYDRVAGGDPLWQETHNAVKVEGGMFNIALGSVDSTLNTYIQSGQRYLGIKVGNDPELSPRMRLASVPYSLKAEKSAHADSSMYAVHADKAYALDAPDGAPQNAVFVDDEGNVEVAGRVKDKTGFMMPVGSVIPFAGDTVFTAGWLVCDGSAISRNAYADLFKVIGITYGGGNGVSTFNLTNLQGRIPVGYDGGQAEFDSLGSKSGEKAHTLTAAEMPVHNHKNGYYDRLLRYNNGTRTAGSSDNTVNEPDITSSGIISNAGGGQSHNNLQPYI
ncbi:MAG: hypothetical protein E4H13_10740, partial [Calditrichales bacterium]